ncbi:hypothetical protein C1I97_16435 [Streptomyces sp. NTH33]|nr:hypothetical protein C1I97_16435 [Streptomyces sp. NTH33]
MQMARRVTAAQLTYCGLAGLVDDATLIVSELVTLAVVHSGGTRGTLALAVRDGFLRIPVHDEMPGSPAVRNVSGEAERGRGLVRPPPPRGSAVPVPFQRWARPGPTGAGPLALLLAQDRPAEG